MNRDRRRDRWCRIAGTVLACALLGPPFFVVCYLAVSGMRGDR
jgi:hypothetical protein